ncbi:MAG: hypothetical protein ABFC84_04135 [Veillonellales bacterium]
MRHRLKRKIVMEVGKTMVDDFDREELKAYEVEAVQEVQETEAVQENIDASISIGDAAETQEVEKKELKIEDIIEPGRYGISNSQMIPAMKKAIAEGSIEKLALLKNSYLYTFDRSIRYLKKTEREFIAKNNI